MAAGEGAGQLLAGLLQRLMRALLCDVPPPDGLTFAGVASLLTAVAFFASYLPARRAAAVEPTLALRQE